MLTLSAKRLKEYFFESVHAAIRAYQCVLQTSYAEEEAFVRHSHIKLGG
jgi:hypothetical protein